MKEKIMNIKNILKIIVLIFVIFSAIKSCSKAYSPQDILDDLTVLRDKGVISGLPTDYSPNAAWTNVIQKYNQKGNFTDYFIAITSSNSSYYSNTLFIGLVYQASGYSVPNQIKNYTTAQNSDLRYTWTGYNNNTIVYGFDSSAFYLNGSNRVSGSLDYGKATFSYFYTTINVNTLTWQQEAGTEYGGNYLTESFEFTPKATEVVDTNVNVQKNIYRLADTELGTITKYLEESRFTYIVLKQNNNIIGQILYNNRSLYDKETNGYMTIQHWFNGQENEQDVLYIFSSALYLDTLYTLEIYNGGENLTTSNYDDKQIFYYMFLRGNAVINNGTITSYGSGDGYTTQDGTNTIVANQNQNDSFWRNAYTTLFQLSSGDVSDLYERISGELGNFTEYTDLDDELQILEELRNTEPGDFAIAWEPVYYQNEIIIPSGEINFTAMVEEYNLEQVHEYAQVIVAGFLALLGLKSIWNYICIALGIGTVMYDDLERENAIVDSVEDYYDEDTGMGYQLNIRKHRNNTNIRRRDTTKLKERNRIGF